MEPHVNEFPIQSNGSVLRQQHLRTNTSKKSNVYTISSRWSDEDTQKEGQTKGSNEQKWGREMRDRTSFCMLHSSSTAPKGKPGTPLHGSGVHSSPLLMSGRHNAVKSDHD
ncbi:hypothetical protein AOLI_G00261490 [Acnodon oligacanthus]